MWCFKSHKVQVPIITRTRSLVRCASGSFWFSCGHITYPLFYLHEPDRFEMETIRHQDAHESGKPAKKPRSAGAFLIIVDKEINALKRVSTMTVLTVH